jgi:hypothetical protein
LAAWTEFFSSLIFSPALQMDKRRLPKTVMPCQANRHFEAIKFQASVHSVGADSTVAG